MGGIAMNLDATLTKRQDRVAGLLVIGKPKKQAADILDISTDTVVNHTRNIYEKLEINSLGELCVWWFVKKFNIDLSEVYKSALNTSLTDVYKTVLPLFFMTLVAVNEINPNGVALRARARTTNDRTIKRKN